MARLAHVGAIRKQTAAVLRESREQRHGSYKRTCSLLFCWPPGDTCHSPEQTCVEPGRPAGSGNAESAENCGRRNVGGLAGGFSCSRRSVGWESVWTKSRERIPNGLEGILSDEGQDFNVPLHSGR